MRSWATSLRAANKSPRTVRTYIESATQFATFLEARSMATPVASIRREYVEAFMEHLLATRKPSTASVRYRSLQQLFKWLVTEGEITESPMAHMSAITVPEILVPVIAREDLGRLERVLSAEEPPPTRGRLF